MKKILIIIPVLFLLILTGCLKDKPNVDFSGLQQIAEISTASNNPTHNAPSGGKAYFSAATLLLSSAPDPDTIFFTVNIASPNPPTKDIAVTLAVDPTALASINADSITNTARIQYVAMPDSAFSFPITTGTVKAGQRLDTFYVIIFSTKVDPTQSFMLPITITDASGTEISGNMSTIYFHTIGNPLAGAYDVTGTRYNFNGVVAWTGPPAAIPSSYVATTDMSLYSPKTALPDDPQTIEIPFANVGTGYNYILTWDGNPADPIGVDFTFDNTYSNIVSYVVSFTPPDATHKAAFHIITHYNNAAAGSGNDRIIDESFVHE
jgi:Domain of unknown function (DUF1735)